MMVKNINNIIETVLTSSIIRSGFSNRQSRQMPKVAKCRGGKFCIILLKYINYINKKIENYSFYNYEK
jgi:hypothetical protein